MLYKRRTFIRTYLMFFIFFHEFYLLPTLKYAIIQHTFSYMYFFEIFIQYEKVDVIKKLSVMKYKIIHSRINGLNF